MFVAAFSEALRAVRGPGRPHPVPSTPGSSLAPGCAASYMQREIVFHNMRAKAAACRI